MLWQTSKTKASIEMPSQNPFLLLQEFKKILLSKENWSLPTCCHPLSRICRHWHSGTGSTCNIDKSCIGIPGTGRLNQISWTGMRFNSADTNANTSSKIISLMKNPFPFMHSSHLYLYAVRCVCLWWMCVCLLIYTLLTEGQLLQMRSKKRRTLCNGIVSRN